MAEKKRFPLLSSFVVRLGWWTESFKKTRRGRKSRASIWTPRGSRGGGGITVGKIKRKTGGRENPGEISGSAIYRATWTILFQYRRSDHQQVLLQNVSLYTSGKYKCEVITEAPSFNAVNAEAKMEIVGGWNLRRENCIMYRRRKERRRKENR